MISITDKSLVCALLAAFIALHAQAAQVDLPAPAGSSTNYASTVTVLPNGNIVVVDFGYSIPSGAANVGAVYLLNGADLSVISTLTGSTANDNVGTNGIVVLSNGNFVIRSANWDNGAAADAGAVTWGSATTGVSGVVSASNSLIGGTAGDAVGGAAVIALSNGHYVVGSTSWDNPTGPVVDVGAATWCNGNGSTVGLITTSNSLVGGTAGDGVGSVTALTNGHYVVSSSSWDNPTGPVANVGAVTWCDGSSGTVGSVTSSNSIVGGSAGDGVGSVTALTNGNYVVTSTTWDNPAGPVVDVGAATWCNGSGGTVGLVTSGNSLTGGMASDFQSVAVTALPNGHYVVANPFWDSPVGPVSGVGAVTWCNGSGGTVGLITSSNSLVGGTLNDNVGRFGIVVLTNNNFVVRSQNWDNPSGNANVGAATWCNGNGGTVGLVSGSNSLIGVGSGGEVVSSGGVVALANGNYVVGSPSWRNPANSVLCGAATWGNGSTGISGPVTAANSLIGSTNSDGVGSPSLSGVPSITALSNGHYVVSTRNWDNPVGPVVNAGAVTWCDGTTGRTGLISASNSLVGGAPASAGSEGVLALTNGHYVVGSGNWTNPVGPVANVGAATWCDGSGVTTGIISASNSLIGSTASDAVSFAAGGVSNLTALPNGFYIVRSTQWNNPTGPVNTAGAVSLSVEATGLTGVISAANSVRGTVTGGISSVTFDPVRQRLFVGRASSKILSVLTIAPEIAIEQPAGTDRTSGSTSIAFGNVEVGASSAAKIFTVKNSGEATLHLASVSAVGGNSGDFVINTTGMLSAVPIGGQTIFTVTMTPLAYGSRTTTLTISNNDVSESPFLITLTGTTLNTTTDTDTDGLNDLAELQLNALGFDWQANQAAQVTALFSNLTSALANLNAAGFFTTAQVQALNAPTPLLQRNPLTGQFTLTLGIEKSTNLSTFNPFPMTAPQTLINGAGKLEFQFTVPDNAAFFQLKAQ